MTATPDSHYCTCHVRHNTDRIISIGQGKYNSDCRALLSLTFSCTNFANVREPLNLGQGPLAASLFLVSETVVEAHLVEPMNIDPSWVWP
jgi:hypothetical protein